MALSDLAVKSAKAKEVPYRLTDEKGLYLLVSKTGARLWRFDYRYLGKRLTLALGQYPDVGLQRAREKRDEARKLVSDGIDPGEHRRQERVRAVQDLQNTFGVVGKEFLAVLKARGASPSTLSKNTWLVEKLAADLTDRPISKITTPEVMRILRAVELSGRRESAIRLRSVISGVFTIAIMDGRAETDPTFPLRNALASPEVQHHPAITVPKDVGGLLRSIDEYDGWPTIRLGFKLIALTFPRPTALRLAEWSEIDWEESVWHIPAGHMKRINNRPRLPLDVPLAKQAREVLREVRELTGRSRLIFPSIRAMDRTLSENAFNSSLRRMGYGKDEMTVHGFRTTASTLLNESGRHRSDVIEFQLAHVEQNKVRGAYNRAEYWDERVALMSDWANMLDSYRRL